MLGKRDSNISAQALLSERALLNVRDVISNVLPT